MTSDLPALGLGTRDAYLRRLGVASVHHDLAGLGALQASHLRAVPFHNLLLLAGDGADPGLPAVELAVEGALRGWGGTCHQLSPPFVALLQALGFEAWLAAASVGAPGDHLVGMVRIGGQTFVCDVGNGHPYLRPFSLDGASHAQTAYGWEFRFEPCEPRDGAATHRLRRRLDDGAWKTVYSLDPRPAEYASFAGIIREHHTRVGFGPFMTGLRAVRMTHDLLLTLRDGSLERSHISGRLMGRRPVEIEAVGRVLERCFGLAELPWQAALTVWQRRMPVRERVELGVEPLRVLVSVGVTGRAGSLHRLGAGLLRARASAGLAGDAVGVLALANGVEGEEQLAAEAAAVRGEGLAVEVVSRTQLGGWHARLHAEGLIADAPSVPVLGIAGCRMLQVAALWEHLTGARSYPGLPQAKLASPLAVWMLDDDLDWSQLTVEAGRLALRHADDRIQVAAQLRHHHPEASVLIGGTTGCPPVPGLAFIAAQLVDLVAHLRAAAMQSPDACYVAAENDRTRGDYYYDHSDIGPAYAVGSFAWEPLGAQPVAVRAALLAHLRAAVGLTWGQPCTRMMVHEPGRPLTPTTARGGNALFLDLDALFSAPPLALRCSDGVVTRRGDTVWGELMASQLASGVFAAPLPLHHTRSAHDHSSPLADADRSGAANWRFNAAQLRGTVLARMVGALRRGESIDADALLRAREARSRASLARAAAALQELSQLAATPEGWLAEDSEVRATLRETIAALGPNLVALTEGATPMTSAEVATELSAFARRAPELLDRWKALWR